MSRFRDVFSSRHVVLPVIHVAGEAQALRNAAIARGAGADGVFLINHSISHDSLLDIHGKVVAEHRDWWVGVNCLDLRTKDVFKQVTADVAGIWVDNAAIDERDEAQPDADEIMRVRDDGGWNGLYFGGVAFKYQRPVEDLGHAAQIAARYMDVVTTSGPGTGSAASPDKIQAMKKGLGEFPLAIASGITPENVADYLSFADCFLVATGISSSFEQLDAQLVLELMQAVRRAE